MVYLVCDYLTSQVSNGETDGPETAISHKKPQTTDPTNQNFSLTKGSPAILGSEKDIPGEISRGLKAHDQAEKSFVRKQYPTKLR
jgi:hypothetical protein